MNTPPPATQPNDLRRRLRELLSIPERDRTEEQWDEIVELEIQLAPGNRAGMTGVPTGKSGGAAPAGNGPQQPRKQHRAKSSNPRRPGKPKPPREPA
ncbi:MAG TPA: hypothetical protein VJ576_10615 [Rhodocyclaceae bacterium]|nr:hypothetical protein [Rhodocyclaceae bacterium]